MYLLITAILDKFQFQLPIAWLISFILQIYLKVKPGLFINSLRKRQEMKKSLHPVPKREVQERGIK
ncbi:hypothetical protein AW879_05370 [Enterobacter cloacae]|nr:hypothetical protein AW879_05370 [Enterobacter cloacae]